MRALPQQQAGARVEAGARAGVGARVRPALQQQEQGAGAESGAEGRGNTMLVKSSRMSSREVGEEAGNAMRREVRAVCEERPDQSSERDATTGGSRGEMPPATSEGTIAVCHICCCMFCFLLYD